MTFLLALALWVVTSVLLALAWAGYRRYVAPYSLEHFDVPAPRTSSEALHR